MQVNLPATGLAPCGVRALYRTSAFASDHAGCLLLPDITRLTSASPQTQALREQQDEDRRRRAEQPAQQQILPPARAASPTEVILEAERELAPNSRAARRALQGECEQKAAQQRDTFQRTLADAAARESLRAVPRGTDGAGELRPDTSNNQVARSDQPPKDAPSRGPAPSAADPSRPILTSEGSQPAATVRAASPPSTAASASGPANVGPVAPVPGPDVPRPSAAARAVEALAGIRPAAALGGDSAPISATEPVASVDARPGNSIVATAASNRGQPSKIATGSLPMPGAAAAEPGKDDANVEQIVRVVRSQIGRDRSQTTLSLEPPELGTVRLHMDLRNEVLALRIETHTALAHRLLTEQVESLRKGLASAGIQLEQVEIRPPPATTAPDRSDLPQPPADYDRGHDQAPDTNAEHSPERGTESSPAPPVTPLARESTLELAAESLVNILA